ncbi:replicative DNA helicase [Megamonas hypermegale]|uniref:replicative DNA helicase n=1 Tax=Megamonas hypermegale TaxID=158847 RepID=UPI0026F22C57|nr:replicative DNA helicase [Megamonas hypermegale]
MLKIPEIPKNIEAEQAVLGSVLINDEVLDAISEILITEDFYRKSHRIIFETMIGLHNERKSIDSITITDKLLKEKKLTQVGGIAFITALANTVPTAVNVMDYAKIVKEKSVLRKVITAAENIISKAINNDCSLDEFTDRAESLMLQATKNSKEQNTVSIKEQALEAFAQIEDIHEHKGKLLGLSTGFTDLDKLLSGLKKSDFIIIAARPSMGKTAFALNIASYLAVKKHVPLAFFSLEMSSSQLLQRIFSSYGIIPYENMKTGNLNNAEWDQLIKISDAVAASQLVINDTVGLNVMNIRSIARKLKREKDIELIIIDYLQLIQSAKRENRNQEISEISRALKLLARELDIPIIALSQLSRSVESRQNKKPMLSDLRESGSLEQDADVVMFLYREDYYEPETENKNITDVIIAKHRNGPIDTTKVFFHKDYVRFQDLVKG